MPEGSAATVKARRRGAASKPSRQSSSHPTTRADDDGAARPTAASTPASVSSSASRRRSSTSAQIRRPPNGWILYRAAKVRQLSGILPPTAPCSSSISSSSLNPCQRPASAAPHDNHDSSLSAKTTTFTGQKELSQYISKCWQAEGDAGKQPWMSLAGQLRDEHKRLYPTYKFEPSRPKAAAATKKEKVQAEQQQEDVDDEAARRRDSLTPPNSKGKGNGNGNGDVRSQTSIASEAAKATAKPSESRKKRRSAPRKSGGSEGDTRGVVRDDPTAQLAPQMKEREAVVASQHHFTNAPAPTQDSIGTSTMPNSYSAPQWSTLDPFGVAMRDARVSASSCDPTFGPQSDLASTHALPVGSTWHDSAWAEGATFFDNTALALVKEKDIMSDDARIRPNGADRPPFLHFATQQLDQSATTKAPFWDTTFDGTSEPLLHGSTQWNDWRTDLPLTCSSAASDVFGGSSTLSSQQQHQTCLSAPADVGNWLLTSPFPTFDASFTGIAAGVPIASPHVSTLYPAPLMSQSTEAESLCLSSQQLSELMSMNVPPLVMPSDYCVAGHQSVLPPFPPPK